MIYGPERSQKVCSIAVTYPKKWFIVQWEIVRFAPSQSFCKSNDLSSERRPEDVCGWSVTRLSSKEDSVNISSVQKHKRTLQKTCRTYDLTPRIQRRPRQGDRTRNRLILLWQTGGGRRKWVGGGGVPGMCCAAPTSSSSSSAAAPKRAVHL